MRALVTGGAGFSGSHLGDRLITDGHRVAVIADLSTDHRDRIPGKVTLHVVDVVNTREVSDVVVTYQYGDGKQTRDYVHPAEAVDAFLVATELTWTPGTSIAASIRQTYQHLAQDT